jgi:hypothetical protein
MVKLINPKTVTFDNKLYSVYKLRNKNIDFPIIIDKDVSKKIEKLNKSWHMNDQGYIVSKHKMIYKGSEMIAEFGLHELIMKLNGFDKKKSILHINKLTIDNRIENLMFDETSKGIKKNIKKKDRTIKLPNSSGIDVDKIPSYVWYSKPDHSHGDRFVIDMGNVVWKSTSSKKVSLKYKFEEVKKYLRYLKNTQPDIFTERSMNGDLNEHGSKLLNSFYEIAKTAGYSNLYQISNNNTDEYLNEDTHDLSEFEENLLDSFNPEIGRVNLH